MQQACSSTAELLGELGLNPRHHNGDDHGFPLRVPRTFVQQMQVGNPHDPLLKQVLPSQSEACNGNAFSQDPVNEKNYIVTPGLIHKYRHRVLIISTSVCPVHCRYCFRRHFPYQEQSLQGKHWQCVLDYLQQHRYVNEVILSGGDPLSLGNEKLAAMAADLQAIEHIRRLRLHSRFPVVLPQRIDAAFITAFQAVALQKIFVIHSNHGNEISDHVCTAVSLLKQAGFTVLNQAVLLRGINDDERVLCELSERLFAAGVLPYYLNVLDRVAGSEHFAVSAQRIKDIYQAVKRALPGFLVPKLVHDTGGPDCKRDFLA